VKIMRCYQWWMQGTDASQSFSSSFLIHHSTPDWRALLPFCHLSDTNISEVHVQW